jgi:hypothetical protein
MGWVLGIAVAWLVCATVLGLLLSRAMRVAEHHDRARRAPRSGNTRPSGRTGVPRPRTAGTRPVRGRS